MLEEQTKKIEELNPKAAKRVLLFLAGYIRGSMTGSDPKRDGYCAFMRGLDSGLIEYGDPNDERFPLSE